MVSDVSKPFELEENETEFYEICSKLRNHAFISPWAMFFKSTDANEFVTEVSELFNDDVTLKMDPTRSAVGTFTSISDDVPKSDIPVDEKKVNRLKESLMSAQESSTVDHIKDLDIFLTISSYQIPVVSEILDVPALNETAITLLLNALLLFKDEISMAAATAIVHYVVLPVISEMRKSNSRSILTSILKFSEAYPKAIIDEVLIPYLNSKTDDLQSEILFQITKVNLPNEYVASCIKSILEHAPPTENLFTVLQYLIERKVPHKKTLHDLILQKLQSWTPECNRNIKFTKLLTSILSTYGSEFTDQQIILCDEVVKNNKTIITKAAENILKKLKQENLP